MNPFPEDFELVGFFCCEPTLSERDVPVFYQRHSFLFEEDGNSIVCEIEPGYGQIDLTWRRDDMEVASFALRRISSIHIKGAPGAEYMSVKFSNQELRDFVLYTKPTVRVEWGNADAI